MKKLLLWLVMVVVMLAVLLGGAGYAMYAMTNFPRSTPLWAIRNWNRSAMTGVCRCWAMC